MTDVLEEIEESKDGGTVGLQRVTSQTPLRLDKDKCLFKLPICLQLSALMRSYSAESLSPGDVTVRRRASPPQVLRQNNQTGLGEAKTSVS